MEGCTCFTAAESFLWLLCLCFVVRSVSQAYSSRSLSFPVIIVHYYLCCYSRHLSRLQHSPDFDLIGPDLT